MQLGFVIGTALSALLNLADVIPARLLFATAATLGALVSAPMAVAGSFAMVIASRFVAGVCLAGVYPPAMKMASTWFRERRGLAVGTVVGALTIGKAGPYLVHAIPHATVIGVTVVSCTSALVAAALVFAGGLARLISLFAVGAPAWPHVAGLVMELAVVPALVLWQARVARSLS